MTGSKGLVPFVSTPREEDLKPGVLLRWRSDPHLRFMLLDQYDNGIWNCYTLWSMETIQFYKSSILEKAEVILPNVILGGE